MENMTDSQVLDRMIEQADGEGFWSKSVDFEELRLAEREDERYRVVINEGSAERWADVRALNVITLFLWDPQWTFETLRREAPNNGDDLIESMDEALVNATSPQLSEEKFDVARSMGFINNVSRMCQRLANDTRKENYTYRVFRVLAQSETKLNIGTNPLGETKEFYGRYGPVKIDREQEAEEQDHQTTSAAEADW